MVSDKRLLGKREKCSYMYEDLNMDNVAIDLDHDLIVDKRKHARNDLREELSINSSDVEGHDLLESEKNNRFDGQQVSSLFKTTRRMQGIVKNTLGRDRFNENLAASKPSALQRGPNLPAKVVGMPVVTPLSAFNSNIIQIRTNDQRTVHRIGQPLSSFGGAGYPALNQPFEFMANRWSGSRGMGFGMEAEGYSQGLYFAPKMNSLRFTKMADITLEDLNPQFADGQLFYQSSQKFRSVKGVLYQIMDEIEEYELLLK